MARGEENEGQATDNLALCIENKLTMASTFESASGKLLEGEHPFPLVDLPRSREDPLWQDLRSDYRLSLAEVSSLKNHVSSQRSSKPQQPTSALRLLEDAKGSPLSDSEVDYALVNYSRFIDEILSKPNRQDQVRLIRRLWLRMSVRIKTQTRLAVSSDYLFIEPVPGSFSNVGTELQFAVKGSCLYCAKIMLDNGVLQKEHSIATAVHENQTCPTVMPVVDLISLPGEQVRVAMITPYYPLPLAPLAHGYFHEEGCINVALCGLATIKAFHSKNLCHGDIKPGNMMFSGKNDNIVVTIDFGSTVRYGESLRSVTPRLGLDCPQEGSLSYDLTCLASTIYVLATGEALPNSIMELLTILESKLCERERPALQIAHRCLDKEGSCDIDTIWMHSQDFVKAHACTLNESLLVSFIKVWPS